MHLLLRTLWLLFSSRRRPRASMFDLGTLDLRVLPTDIDVAGHLNNGMYFSLFDLGRFDLMARSGVWGIARRRGWTPVVQAETITFRKSLLLGARYTIETRLIGADERCIYFEQRMVAGGEVCARGHVATRLVSTAGPVPNEEIFAAAGLSLPEDRVLPEWLHEWRERTALPGSRRPAPSLWR